VAVGSEPAERPVARMRPDLLISPQLFYGKLCFVVKDPLTLRYFRLQPVEHFLLTQFDGRKNSRDLLSLLQQRFPEGTLTVQDILRFVGMLHESHLLVGQGLGHSDWLGKSRGDARRKRFKELAQNFLFFKIPVFHPNRLLGFLDRTLGKIIFSRAIAITAIAVILLALWNVLMSVDRLMNLPYNLMSWQNILVMYCVFIGTKIFHEFGHGMAAKHFGGEVSTMGIMLFIITPSFYCDTSDAWMIPSRPARLWINAGGIVVELVIAALASFVWLYTSDDAMINQIALNVMISCSVTTLFFNANPLMRFDGYYFLADLLEIPNLMGKSRELVGCYAQKYVLGLKPKMPPDENRAGWLVAYAIGSTIYRWVIMFGIVALLYYLFSQIGLGPIGVLLAVIYVVMTVLWPVGKTLSFLWKQRWDVGRRLAYMGVAAGFGLAVLLGIALMPWKMAIREPLVVLSEQDEPVYVSTPGYVQEVLHDAGDTVKKGDIILTLADPALQTLLDGAVSKREGEVLHATQAASENAPAVLAASNEAIIAYDKQISLIKERMSDLVLRAPVDGVVIQEASLKRNVGNYLPSGLKVCRVIQTDHLEARISLPQQEAALVREGMAVRIRLWSQPEHVITTHVLRISSSVNDQLLHPALGSSLKGEVAVTADENGRVKSAGRRSTVVMKLSPGDELYLADGMTGRGEIEVQQTTVIGRVWRLVLDSTTPDWHL